MRARRSGGRRRRSAAAAPTPSTGGYRQLAFQPCSKCCAKCADKCISGEIPATLTAVLPSVEAPLIAGSDCDNLTTLGGDCTDMFGTFQLDYKGYSGDNDPICDSCPNVHVWQYYEPLCDILGYTAYHDVTFCVVCSASVVDGQPVCHATLVSRLIWRYESPATYITFHTWMWWQEWERGVAKTSWDLVQATNDTTWGLYCGAYEATCRQICENYSATCIPPQNTFANATVS